jgi:hypothetical protein
MFGIYQKDIEESLKLIDSAIRKRLTFKKSDNKQVLKFIMEETKDVIEFIVHYLKKDTLYIHHHKKNLLSNIINKLDHLISSCRYYYNYSQFDHNALMAILIETESLFYKYSECGSMYVFRHCEKAKRTDIKGRVYDGIPTHAVRSQAMKRAKEIIDEIYISPKKVRVIFYHTEEKRTKIFADIIRKEITHHLSHCKNKVEIINHGYDHRIRAGYFSDEALDELMSVYKEKGDFYTIKAWYFHENEFKHFKLQPNPHEVAAGMNDFVTNNYHWLTGRDYYTIIIAVSHSFIIDAYLLHKIPGLEHQIKHTIKTASFFKVECGEMNYLGKWVGI